MSESFSDMLAVDGKKNSLGLVNEVIKLVLDDQSRLEELYESISHEDAWVRMRAIDAFEKVCREHPEWVKPYINRIQKDLVVSTQPSIQWHIAQIYDQIDLDETQKTKAIDWLKKLLSTKEVDWIVAANCMKTLAGFVRSGDVSKSDLTMALEVQQGHKSNAVIKRAQKLLSEFS
jgi:hypothetical protein